jgi:hypothetical protein
MACPARGAVVSARDGGPGGYVAVPAPGPRVAVLAPASRRPERPFSMGRAVAGQRADIPRMLLRRTFNGPRLAPPEDAASGEGHDDPDASMPTGRFQGRRRTTTMLIGSAGQPRYTVMAEPLTDDSQQSPCAFCGGTGSAGLSANTPRLHEVTQFRHPYREHPPEHVQ